MTELLFCKVCLLSLLYKHSIAEAGELLKYQLLCMKLLGDRIYSSDLNPCNFSEDWIAEVLCEIALCYQYASSNKDVLQLSHEC